MAIQTEPIGNKLGGASFLTTRQAAERMGVSIGRVKQLSQRLGARLVGMQLLIPLRNVERWCVGDPKFRYSAGRRKCQ